MSNSDKLLKNTLIYTIGNLGSRLLSFLLVPLYSFYLSRSDLGYYDLIITSISLLIPFITLQISDAAYRWLLDAKNDETLQKQAISNGVFVLIINTIFFFILYFIISYFWQFKYFMYFSILLFLSALMPFFQQSIRGLGNNKLYSTTGIVNTLLLVLFNLFFLFYTNMKVSGLLVSTIFANTLTILIIFFRCKLHRFLSIRLVVKENIIKMIKYSWPLIPNTISWWLINEVNRFVILYYMGAEYNGIFALSNRFPSIMLILNSIFMLSWQDHAITAHNDKEKDQFYSKIFNIYMALELTMVIFLTSVSKFMVGHIIGPKFYQSWQYMPVLYLSVAFSSFAAFLGAGYLGAKKTGGIFTTTIIGSVINIVISVLLIKKIGLYAPTIGTLVGFLVIYIIRIYQTKEFFTIKIDYKVFIFLLVTSVVYMKLVSIGNRYVDVAAFIGAIIIGFICNKKLIVYLYNFINNNVINRQKLKGKAL